MRRPLAASALALVLASVGGRVAHAQFVTSGDKLSEASGQNVEEAKLIGRLYSTIGYYGEAASGGNGMDASPDALLWGDLRGRIEADHLSGSAWDVLGDFRLRFTPDADYLPKKDQLRGPGWAGGNEYDLHELFVRYNTTSSAFSLGRLVLRDLDAMTVDGASFAMRPSASFEYGAAAGMFPNPYSRSLDTDYKLPAADARSITGYPVAAGAWGGYRMAAFYGSFGLGFIAPRNSTMAVAEPVRTFLTARGYARASATVNFFHYGVVDFGGAAGTQLTNLQVGGNWMATPELRVELAYSHMSTYAIETYLRDYLEAVPTPAAAGAPSNNLDVARMAADEGRVGADYAFIQERADIFGQVRYRRRATIATANLDPTVAGLAPDTQLDVSVGARKKELVAGWDLGVNAAYIAGGRTKSFYGFLRGHRAFVQDTVDVDLDAGYVTYQDNCPAMGDDTCLGGAKGSTIRVGGTVAFRQSENWLFVGDVHLGFKSSSFTVGTTETTRPNLFEQMALLRAQYSF